MRKCNYTFNYTYHVFDWYLLSWTFSGLAVLCCNYKVPTVFWKNPAGFLEQHLHITMTTFIDTNHQ